MLVSVGYPTAMEGLIYPVPFAGPEDLVRIAQAAERLGYHSIWGNDHLTTQHYVRAEYKEAPRFFEPLVSFAFVAAATTRLRLGTGLLVLPMRRDIVVVAKQVATLDHFAQGRLEIGLGVGAYREEFEAVQPGFKAHRGDMVEEGIRALRALFAERSASFDGRYYRFKEVELSPKPRQDNLPLLIGGNNENAWRRAAFYGDGWIPAGIAPERLAADAAKMRELAAARGRDPRRLSLAPQYICCVDRTHEKALERFRRSQVHTHLLSLRKSTLKEQGTATFEEINLIGSIEHVREKVGRLAGLGVDHLLGIIFAANTVAELIDQMELFATEISPAARGDQIL
jgi:probable F420-dependent oxidoreductase